MPISVSTTAALGLVCSIPKRAVGWATSQLKQASKSQAEEDVPMSFH